jgi:hypothetical protein
VAAVLADEVDVLERAACPSDAPDASVEACGVAIDPEPAAPLAAADRDHCAPREIRDYGFLRDARSSLMGILLRGNAEEPSMNIRLLVATVVAAGAAATVVAFSLGGGPDHDEQDHLPPEWRHPRFERAAALEAPSR